MSQTSFLSEIEARPCTRRRCHRTFCSRWGSVSGDAPELWIFEHPDRITGPAPQLHRGRCRRDLPIVRRQPLPSSCTMPRVRSGKSIWRRRPMPGPRPTTPAGRHRRRLDRPDRRDLCTGRHPLPRGRGCSLCRAGESACRGRRRRTVDRDHVVRGGAEGGRRRRGDDQPADRHHHELRHERPHHDGRHARRPSRP